MTLLSAPRILDLINSNVITADPKNVNSASVDITIGDEVLIEDVATDGPIDIDAKQSPAFTKVKIPTEGIIIYPGQCFLAHTNEYFNLPDNIAAEFVLRSSMARCFMNHMLAGFCDPGWNGSQLTMEFKNETQFHSLLIKPGMRVGQMKFFETDGCDPEHSYSNKGNYNNQQGATMAFTGEGHNAS
ncbi:MAG: dCTP deaminase [Cetobacterium sp.]|uniref:dCTP deaminase n=1 Tax=Cetobacterium sp. TaxID=2071632 RepID=UPI003EE6B13E